MVSRALTALGWLVVSVLGFFALMRLVAWDAAEPLIIVNALTMVAYLPAWCVAIAAAICRRWLLALAAGIVVAAQIGYVVPEVLASAPIPRWAAHAPTLRVLDANVDKSTEFSSGYSRAIGTYHPDIVTLEELTPAGFHQLTLSGALKDYPFLCVAPQPGATGFLIASRVRMTACRVHVVSGTRPPTPYLLSAIIHLHGVRLQLLVVHTLAPLPVSWHEWTAALRAIDKMVAAGQTGHMLFVGDFNATWGNRNFASLLAAGLTDGAAARGDPFAMTWPNGAVVPPFIRIDHVLTGSGLAVTRIADAAGYGSDHRFLTATIAVLP